MGLLLEADQAILVLWSSPGLHGPVSANAESTVVAMSKRRSLDSCLKNIVLIISLSEEFEHFWVLVIADCTKNHVVSLL